MEGVCFEVPLDWHARAMYVTSYVLSYFQDDVLNYEAVIGALTTTLGGNALRVYTALVLRA